MSRLLLIPLLMLAGCDSSEPYKVDNTEFRLEIRLVDQIDYKGQMAAGLSQMDGETCIVTLLAEEYPRCLQHEVRHCIEGNWHEGRNTIGDCFE